MSGILCFDIETLGTESNSVVLSAAIVYADLDSMHTWESLYTQSEFVKFSVEEQIKNYKRTVDRNTVEWWNKQCDMVKRKSFIPSKDDLSAKEGITKLRAYIKDKCDPEKTTIWTRGNLDQVAFDSLSKDCDEEVIMNYYNYRDVRTFVDVTANTSKRGYCKISKDKYPEFDNNIVMKHNPIDDIVYDVLMMLYYD